MWLNLSSALWHICVKKSYDAQALSALVTISWVYPSLTSSRRSNKKATYASCSCRQSWRHLDCLDIRFCDNLDTMRHTDPMLEIWIFEDQNHYHQDKKICWHGAERCDIDRSSTTTGYQGTYFWHSLHELFHTCHYSHMTSHLDMHIQHTCQHMSHRCSTSMPIGHPHNAVGLIQLGVLELTCF